MLVQLSWLTKYSSFLCTHDLHLLLTSIVTPKLVMTSDTTSDDQGRPGPGRRHRELVSRERLFFPDSRPNFANAFTTLRPNVTLGTIIPKLLDAWHWVIDTCVTACDCVCESVSVTESVNECDVTRCCPLLCHNFGIFQYWKWHSEIWSEIWDRNILTTWKTHIIYIYIIMLGKFKSKAGRQTQTRVRGRLTQD